uniref:helix-turn-helix domain-containing protein n=1 Tax=Proteus mirabilis TaxID=584 RepID=UPI001954A08C
IMLGVKAGSWIGGLGIAGGFGLQGALWVGAALGVLALLTLLPELRFARAKELLQSGDMPIYRIAEELGFSETASLRHAFQRWSGQPPSHFRA